MRYIGSKKNLLPAIKALLQEKTDGNEQSFLDLFAGTGAVAEYFKPKYQIISNDMMYFSYVILKNINLTKSPKFSQLLKLGIHNPIQHLNNLSELESGYITQHYSPSANSENRMYVTVENAMRIDTIRSTIATWHHEQHISDDEYYYLLNSLIQAVPYVSNITGTYGAFLKTWDKRAHKTLSLESNVVLDNQRQNEAYHLDANLLIKQLPAVDIAYIDPPYNARQYTSNYHFLETIARNDQPEIKGVTGMRQYQDEEKSKYCSKRFVYEQVDHLIEHLQATHIIFSYSSDGLLSKQELLEILNRHCLTDSVQILEMDYRRYKSKIVKTDGVVEYLFYAKKNVKPKPTKKSATKKNNFEPQSKNTLQLGDTSGELISSPLNYIGGKFKLLPQILPLFPKKIDTLVDLFCGGLNVTANVNATTRYANDLNDRVIDVLKVLQCTPIDDLLKQIYTLIEQYQLTLTNQDGFIKLRQDYNQQPDPLKLYVLVCYSFNYQFRFNNNMEFNNPFGKERSQFSDTLKQKLIRFNHRIQSQEIHFSSVPFQDFIELQQLKLGQKDLVYCDPPYLITLGSYNDGKRGFKSWTAQQDQDLFDLLDQLNAQGVKFALSNVLEHKGLKNEYLIEWAKQYKIHHLTHSYKNSNYQTKRGDSSEVLICNY